eukprot:jgi/Chrzof1/447/Cz01g16060.t1
MSDPYLVDSFEITVLLSADAADDVHSQHGADSVVSGRSSGQGASTQFTRSQGHNRSVGQYKADNGRGTSNAYDDNRGQVVRRDQHSSRPASNSQGSCTDMIYNVVGHAVPYGQRVDTDRNDRRLPGRDSDVEWKYHRSDRGNGVAGRYSTELQQRPYPDQHSDRGTNVAPDDNYHNRHNLVRPQAVSGEQRKVGRPAVRPQQDYCSTSMSQQNQRSDVFPSMSRQSTGQYGNKDDDRKAAGQSGSDRWRDRQYRQGSAVDGRHTSHRDQHGNDHGQFKSDNRMQYQHNVSQQPHGDSAAAPVNHASHARPPQGPLRQQYPATQAAETAGRGRGVTTGRYGSQSGYNKVSMQHGQGSSADAAFTDSRGGGPSRWARGQGPDDHYRVSESRNSLHRKATGGMRHDTRQRRWDVQSNNSDRDAAGASTHDVNNRARDDAHSARGYLSKGEYHGRAQEYDRPNASSFGRNQGRSRSVGR